VQGIEALQAGDVGVRSLQDWAAYVRSEDEAPAARPEPTTDRTEIPAGAVS
jgi:hypothetical protein